MNTLSSLPQLAQKNGPWSISKLGVISQCSLKFDYKYGSDKIKEESTFEENLVGVVVHHALELALGGTPVKQAFQVAMNATPMLSDQADTVRGFYEQVAKFVTSMAALRKLWQVPDNLNSVMIERKWGLAADFSGCGFFDKPVVFRGVVDYALLTAKNNMVIIDHKTGKERDLEYYDAQFKAYCLLALAKNPSIKAVHTGINFVMNDRMCWAPTPITAEQIRDEYRPWLISYITEACSGLGEAPKPTKQPLCDWCGYKNICPAHGGAGREATKQE